MKTHDKDVRSRVAVKLNCKRHWLVREATLNVTQYLINDLWKKAVWGQPNRHEFDAIITGVLLKLPALRRTGDIHDE